MVLYIEVWLMVVGLAAVVGILWLISLGCRKPARKFNRETGRLE
jgi:hypothetical protein